VSGTFRSLIVQKRRLSVKKPLLKVNLSKGSKERLVLCLVRLFVFKPGNFSTHGRIRNSHTTGAVTHIAEAIC